MAAGDDQRPAMTTEEFELLRELVHAHCGIALRDELRFVIERRLAPRLRVLELADFSAYYRHLRFADEGKAELEAAVECLATHETYFFREPEQLGAFTDELLPRLRREREHVRRLRFWSAGCSSGEEAYTIAMLLLEHGGFRGWDVEVFGSDISRKVLTVARKGEYGSSALRSTSPERLARFFDARDGRHRVRDEVRELVSFGHLNLLDPGMLGLVGTVDAIFCRNVMIYFDLPARRRVLASFFDKLAPGGFLLLGHSESLLHVTADFELCHLARDLVYRKPAGAGGTGR